MLTISESSPCLFRKVESVGFVICVEEGGILNGTSWGPRCSGGKSAPPFDLLTQAWYQQQAMYMQEYGYAPDVAQHHAYAQYAATAMDPTYGYYNYWGTEQQDDQVKRQR